MVIMLQRATQVLRVGPSRKCLFRCIGYIGIPTFVFYVVLDLWKYTIIKIKNESIGVKKKD